MLGYFSKKRLVYPCEYINLYILLPQLKTSTMKNKMINNSEKLTSKVISQLTEKYGDHYCKEIIKDCAKFDRAYAKRDRAVKDITTLRNIVLKRCGFDDPNSEEAFDFCGGNLLREYLILEKIEFRSYSNVIHNQIRNLDKSKHSVWTLNSFLNIY